MKKDLIRRFVVCFFKGFFFFDSNPNQISHHSYFSWNSTGSTQINSDLPWCKVKQIHYLIIAVFNWESGQPKHASIAYRSTDSHGGTFRVQSCLALGLPHVVSVCGRARGAEPAKVVALKPRGGPVSHSGTGQVWPTRRLGEDEGKVGVEQGRRRKAQPGEEMDCRFGHWTGS